MDAGLYSDDQALLLACRAGDLDQVKFLIHTKEVSANIRDCWDSTPLYYACLCGCEDIVEFLLQNGATCEENTFDGERCVYGALTDRIRNLLRSYRSLTYRVTARRHFEEFLRKILKSQQFADVEFYFSNQNCPSLRAHRCILMARSPLFLHKFLTSWSQKARIRVKAPITPHLFHLLLQFIYTGRLEVPREYIDEVKLMCRKCGLAYVAHMIDVKVLEMQNYTKSKQSNMRVLIYPIEDRPERLRSDLHLLVKHCLPKELLPGFVSELPFLEEQQSLATDVHFLVEGHTFACHQVFMCGRTDYFHALMHFQQQTTRLPLCSGGDAAEQDGDDDDNDAVSPRTQVVTLANMPVTIFWHLLQFIYQDGCDPESVEEALTLLEYAEMCFLPRLKLHCANFLEKCLTVENVSFLFYTGRQHTLGRLEHVCSAFMANHLTALLQEKAFKELVLHDAQSLVVREECDTIDVIDQIRHHISTLSSVSDCASAMEKQAWIDEFLDDLNLCA